MFKQYRSSLGLSYCVLHLRMRLECDHLPPRGCNALHMNASEQKSNHILHFSAFQGVKTLCKGSGGIHKWSSSAFGAEHLELLD